MATVEKLHEHLKKTQSDLEEVAKKNSHASEIKNFKKKTKRLARKASKITATEKNG